MTTTIKDVAKKANVSIATVSLVIHNNSRISPKTKRRVQKAIDELGYHPTRSARGLVSQKSGNIGFILTEDHFTRSEPFYSQIFLGTEFFARDFEYYILLTTIDPSFSEHDHLPRFVLENNVDGVILAGKVPDNLIHRLQQYHFPLVFVDYYPSFGNFPVVMIDNMNAGLQATQHLLNCNHRHIAFVAGDITHPSIQERFQGYKMALEQAGVPFDVKKTIVGQPYPSRENGYKAAKQLLNQCGDVTAIFACNDAMAIGALHYLKKKKYRVPHDISLIGFDDVEADIYLDPPLTTMRVPKIDMGLEAAQLMVDVLNNKSKNPRKVLVPAELIVRKSTCPQE